MKKNSKKKKSNKKLKIIIGIVLIIVVAVAALVFAKPNMLKRTTGNVVNSAGETLALGYVSSDDYHPFDEALSVEEYLEELKSMDLTNYTDESKEKINGLIDSLENPENSEYEAMTNILEKDQYKMDALLEKMHSYVYDDVLEKTSADYSDLCKYYNEALSLNLDEYDNTSALQNILLNIDWNLSANEQAKVDTQSKELLDALNALKKKGETTTTKSTTTTTSSKKVSKSKIYGRKTTTSKSATTTTMTKTTTTNKNVIAKIITTTKSKENQKHSNFKWWIIPIIILVLLVGFIVSKKNKKN